jgi:YHS domain-containing protein
MAHQTNIIQVGKSIQSSDQPAEVIDPVCGMKINRKECRHMLFRPDNTFYFCSRECEQKFMSRGFQAEQKKKAA